MDKNELLFELERASELLAGCAVLIGDESGREYIRQRVEHFRQVIEEEREKSS